MLRRTLVLDRRFSVLNAPENLQDPIPEPCYIPLGIWPPVLAGMCVLEVDCARRFIPVPGLSRFIDHEDAGTGAGKAELFGIRIRHGGSTVPILGCSRIRNEMGHPIHMSFARAVAWHPHYISDEVGIVDLCQYLSLRFGGPPKTASSRRRHQHENTRLVDIGVECGSKGLALRVESYVACTFHRRSVCS